MKFLLNKQASSVAEQAQKRPDLVLGQLITPLNGFLHCMADGTRWDGPFAVDNGAYARFDRAAFEDKLRKCQPIRERCVFVAAPDVVGSARRTLEAFDYWYPLLSLWPVALVAQDGQESLPIPWAVISAVFIGGTDGFKDSASAADIVKTAKLIGKHVHVGRVNEVKRFVAFKRLGADTCDGSGVSIFCDEKLQIIEDRVDRDTPLFMDCC